MTNERDDQQPGLDLPQDEASAVPEPRELSRSVDAPLDRPGESAGWSPPLTVEDPSPEGMPEPDPTPQPGPVAADKPPPLGPADRVRGFLGRFRRAPSANPGAAVDPALTTEPTALEPATEDVEPEPTVPEPPVHPAPVPPAPAPPVPPPAPRPVEAAPPEAEPPTAIDAPADEPEPMLAPTVMPTVAPAPDEEAELAAAPVVGFRRSAGISAYLVVLTGLATVVILSFVLMEPSPRWVLLLGAAAVTFGLDGTLRQTWREPFASGAETAPYLFVPALYMLAVPVLIEHNVPGESVFLVGLLAGLGFGALAWAETASVRPHASEHARGRIIATAATYLVGFAIFSLTYVFDVALPAAIAAIAIASAMLAVELMREGEIDPLETLGFATVTGIVMAETRWLLYYLPLETYLAGLTLLLVFYLVTGLLHSHVTRALNTVLALEYGAIAAAGVALVVFARTAGLA